MKLDSSIYLSLSLAPYTRVKSRPRANLPSTQATELKRAALPP